MLASLKNQHLIILGFQTIAALQRDEKQKIAIILQMKVGQVTTKSIYKYKYMNVLK